MATAFVHLDAAGHATLKTPYRAGFVEALKELIPWEEREWRPEIKLWWIDTNWVDDAIALCREWYDAVEIIEPERERASSPPQAEGPYAALHLLPDAPWPLVETVYRKLAAMHHPDLGGDVRTMQQINTAYDRLRKLRTG